MKSTIRIDVDHDNQPIIRIKYEESDDIKDKLVKIFLDTFGDKSCWAMFKYADFPPNTNSDSIIRPIAQNDIPEAWAVMKNISDIIVTERNTTRWEYHGVHDVPKTTTANSASITKTVTGDNSIFIGEKSKADEKFIQKAINAATEKPKQRKRK